MKSNTPPPATEASAAYPTGSDREVLLYLMQQFDGESWECERCGHSEDTATMDSADYLRRYLAEHPAPAAAVGGDILHPAQKALRRIRNVADSPGTVVQHGKAFAEGMRRAANIVENAISKPTLIPSTHTEEVVERALTYLHPHLDLGTEDAPAWAIQLASILTGGDGCGVPISATHTPPAGGFVVDATRAYIAANEAVAAWHNTPRNVGRGLDSDEQEELSRLERATDTAYDAMRTAASPTAQPSADDAAHDYQVAHNAGEKHGRIMSELEAAHAAQPSAKDGVRGEEGCFARGAGLKTCECAKCLALEAEIVAGEIGSRIDILRRICKRGRNYFLGKEDSTGIDLFEHMETEVGWLASTLSKATAAAGLADVQAAALSFVSAFNGFAREPSSFPTIPPEYVDWVRAALQSVWPGEKEEDDGSSDYATRQLGRWNREFYARKRVENEARFDAFHAELKQKQTQPPAGKEEAAIGREESGNG